MTAGPEEPLLDVERILDTLERHHLKYLVLGGTAANAYGAQRITKDFDCLPERSLDNLARLAGAMRELNARLRVAGLTDAEAQRLPVHVDAHQLRQVEPSTWRTDAGDFDVLADLPDRRGRHLGYEDLTGRAVTDLGGLSVRVAALDDVIASRSGPPAPRTTRRSLSCASCAKRRSPVTESWRPAAPRKAGAPRTRAHPSS